MDARQLLQSIEARGGVVTVKHESGGAKINVAPRSIALELLPEIARFKPALLELLAPTATAPPPPDSAAFWRDVAAAIQNARRGAHLAYTPELARAWKAANRATERNLSSAQLCEVAQENNQP
jgi:hypothetical protein